MSTYREPEIIVREVVETKVVKFERRTGYSVVQQDILSASRFATRL